MSLLSQSGFKNQTVVLGAAHVGVEDMLMKSHEERLRFLQRFQPLLKKLALPDYLSSITVMNYSGGEWKVKRNLDDQDLRTLLQ